MGKVEVSALIKAIQESVSLLVSDGVAPRERITDPVNDAARVQDLESGYSTEIDDIVDNIPDVPPTPPAPTFNLKVYGYNGCAISLSQENNFMYVFDEPNNRYIMLEGGTSSTIWEIVSIIDTNGNEVSKESDYIWWINKSNIYYISSPTRSIAAAYILLKTTPPIS